MVFFSVVSPTTFSLIKKGASLVGHAPSWNCRSGLLALMTVLAQSLFALMRSHLVAFLLFTVWHNNKFK